jgi:hypothetical protein
MTYSFWTIPITIITLGNWNCNVTSVDKSAHLNKLPRQVDAIALPEGFVRVPQETASFCEWLRKVNLKSDPTVYLYNGKRKENQQAQYAVLDIPVPTVDLQQCADAVIRLRASWLFDTKQYSKIQFTDNEGGQYVFREPYTREHFEQYLLKVFAQCGTASLAKQLYAQQWSVLRPGDVLVKGGFPGHAVMVMDVAKNTAGRTIYLLSQSYMPAQDIHLLKNTSSPHLSPWYLVEDVPSISTPEYEFDKTALRTWDK